MEREGERMFLECLDQLQVATANMDEVSNNDNNNNNNNYYHYYCSFSLLDCQN